jgi:hypothetical protein
MFSGGDLRVAVVDRTGKVVRIIGVKLQSNWTSPSLAVTAPR